MAATTGTMARAIQEISFEMRRAPSRSKIPVNSCVLIVSMGKLNSTLRCSSGSSEVSGSANYFTMHSFL